MTKLGRLLVLFVALLVTVEIVRNAAVQALSDHSPVAAARVWPDHPSAELAVAMSNFKSAAREQTTAHPLFAMVRDVARKAPLAPEPFLVRGIELQLAGNIPVSIEAFRAAEKRDPRSVTTRYLLADLYFRTDDPHRAIQEIAALARLAPDGLETITPYIAVYARDRSTWPELKSIFRANPRLEDASLTALAADPDNAQEVLALAGPELAISKSHWAPVLVHSLLGSGRYSEAQALWARISHVPGSAGSALIGPSSSNPKAGPLFGWELISSGPDTADSQTQGGLHVIYYGHSDGVLARRLLLLGPGSYRMDFSVSSDGSTSRSFSWSLRCDKVAAPFASMPLEHAARQGWIFIVPHRCPAQWIELRGRRSDVGHQLEIRLTNLRLVQEGQPSE